MVPLPRPRQRRSRSRHHTLDRPRPQPRNHLPHDLTDPAAIATHLATLAQQVAHDAADAGRTITRVTVKIRTTPFQTRTRQTKLPTPTTDPATITRTALDILDRHDLTHPVRLIGVAVEYTMPKT
ncbi:hypothetical protein [[Actinomadura] parvosata]|uniref:DinB/UmuC family translesion DNA polymerase n=1 Tax=[Actinomadura] parvosata TaxID=1955412 RepID=UPI003B96B293